MLEPNFMSTFEIRHKGRALRTRRGRVQNVGSILART